MKGNSKNLSRLKPMFTQASSKTKKEATGFTFTLPLIFSRKVPQLTSLAFLLCLALSPAQESILPENLPSNLDFELDFELEEEEPEQAAELKQAKIDPKLALSQSSNAFGLSFYRLLAEQERSDNLCYSPLNLSIGFWMTYSGARNLTAKELQKTFQLPLSAEKVQENYLEFINQIQQAAQPKQHQNAMAKGETTRLIIANSLFITTFQELFSEQFKTILESKFQALISQTNPREALKPINAWVAQKSQQQIADFFQQIQPTNAAKNFNVLSITAPWENNFPRNQSRKLNFRAFNWRNVPTPFIQQTGNFTLLNKDNFQLISLPFEDSSLTLQILLPSKDQSLFELEQTLTLKQFNEWQAELEAAQKQRIKLSLPKLEVRSSTPINDVLKKLGMMSIFKRGKADLSGMGSTPGDIYFGEKSENQSSLRLDEAGFSFAAATSVSVQTQEQQIQQPRRAQTLNFQANRPFLYWVVEEQTDTILMIGRYIRPDEAKPEQE